MQKSFIVKLLRVNCPLCKTESVFEIDEQIIMSARASSQGLIGLIEIHGDHAFVVYIDGNGNERGRKVFSTISGITKAREVRLPYKYSLNFENIYGFGLSLKPINLVIDCWQKFPEISYKTLVDDISLELGIKDYSKLNISYRIMKSFLTALKKAIQDVTISALYDALLILDHRMNYKVTPNLDKIFEIIFKSRNFLIEVDKDAIQLFSTYYNIFEHYFPHIKIKEYMDLDGLKAVELLRGKSLTDGYEILSFLSMLYEREIIKFRLIK